MSNSSFVLRSFNASFVALLALAAAITLPIKTLAQETTPNDTKTQPGCLSGYPDGTYRGDQPVTRNEFAAGTNECLEQIRRPVFDRSKLATREDIQALIERQRELNAELRQLSDRVGGMTEK